MATPLDRVYTKLKAGQNAVISAIGDSTVNGANCTDAGGNSGGWCGQLVRKIAADLDVNARVYVYWGSWSAGPVITTTRAGAPWVAVYDGGVLAAQVTTHYMWMNSPGQGLPGSTPNIRSDADLVMCGTGINDLSNGQSIPNFIAEYATWIADMKGRVPAGTPFVVTTENPVNEAQSANYVNIANGFRALALAWAGQALPIDGVTTTSMADVWFLDSRQAFGNAFAPALMADYFHPSCAGYVTQGNYVFDQLKANYLAVSAVAPAITTTELGDLRRGTSFTQTLAATGTAPITFAVQSGALPTGLTLSASGELTGTPTTAGPYTVTVRATNAAGTADQQYAGTVIGTPPAITTTTLGALAKGDTVSLNLAATGTTPIAWSVQSGSLPAGLTLSGSGVVFGTPTAAGAYSVTVRATNSYGTADQTFTGSVTAPFAANSFAKPKIKLGGRFYPITIKAKTGGVVRRALPRNGAM